MAQLIVGLDVGHHSLKRVRLRSSFRTVEVADAVEAPVPQDERPFTARAMEALRALGNGGGVADLVTVALPGDEVSIRLLTLPFADAKRIAQTVGYELEGQIPFSLEEVVYDYLSLGKTAEGGMRLLVALCQVDPFGKWLVALKEAGVDPRLVGAESLSYSSLVRLLPRAGAATEAAGPEPEPDSCQMVLDIGHRLTSLCVLGPDGVEFARTLSGGGRDMTAHLAEAFKISEERAEDGKQRAGFVESKELSASTADQTKVSDALRRSLAHLLREVRQTLSTHRTLSSHPVRRLWLCGGGAGVANLDRYLAEELQLQVLRLRPEGLALSGAERLAAGAGHWIKALGLALHAHQGGRLGFLNLRRGSFAFKGDFEAVRGKLAHLAVAVLILLFLAGGAAVIKAISLSKAERALDERLREVTQAVLGKPYDNPEIAMSVIKEKTSPASDPLPRLTALDALREIHGQIPPELKLRLKDVNIAPKKIRVEGFTDTFESVEKIKASLQKVECFNDIQTGNTRKTKDETEVQFELTIVVGC